MMARLRAARQGAVSSARMVSSKALFHSSRMSAFKLWMPALTKNAAATNPPPELNRAESLEMYFRNDLNIKPGSVIYGEGRKRLKCSNPFGHGNTEGCGTTCH